MSRPNYRTESVHWRKIHYRFENASEKSFNKNKWKTKKDFQLKSLILITWIKYHYQKRHNHNLCFGVIGSDPITNKNWKKKGDRRYGSRTERVKKEKYDFGYYRYEK